MAVPAELLSLSEDELFVEIGRALEGGQVGALPHPIAVLRRRGEQFVNGILDQLRQVVCPSGVVRSFAESGNTTELVVAVLTLIERLALGTAAAPTTVLICKRGVSALCAKEWSKKPGETKHDGTT